MLKYVSFVIHVKTFSTIMLRKIFDGSSLVTIMCIRLSFGFLVCTSINWDIFASYLNLSENSL